jgi:hypothetical protein
MTADSDKYTRLVVEGKHLADWMANSTWIVANVSDE